MKFNKGDILKASDRSKGAGFHPIVFLEKQSNTDFIGAILTHSNNASYGNIPMEESHFNHVDEKHSFKFDQTLLVKARLLKPRQWGPYIKYGSLTQEGIDFLEIHLTNTPALDWEAYIHTAANS